MNDDKMLWRLEPDSKVWIDADTDLDCIARRSHLWAWCGYVGVPKSNRAHGKHYDHPSLREIDVHGGLTYSMANSKDLGLDEGEDLWWLGFDCAHAWDLIPVFVDTELAYGGILMPTMEEDHYRDLPYVHRQCTHLAELLNAMSA